MQDNTARLNAMLSPRACPGWQAPSVACAATTPELRKEVVQEFFFRTAFCRKRAETRRKKRGEQHGNHQSNPGHITKCIGCRSCEQACKQIHGFPMDSETKLPHRFHRGGRARRPLRPPHVHALSGPGLRFSVSRRRLKKTAAARSLMTRKCIAAATVWGVSVQRAALSVVEARPVCDKSICAPAAGERPATACVEACPYRLRSPAIATKFWKRRSAASSTIRNT